MKSLKPNATPQKKKLHLARDRDRVRAAGLARLFREGKATGNDLATALEILAVRGTFDTDFPGLATLSAELAAFDEAGQTWNLQPSDAQRRRSRDDLIRRRYDALRANGITREEAELQIAEEGELDWQRHDELLRERLGTIDWPRFRARLSELIDQIPLPRNSADDKKHQAALNAASARCSKEFGVSEIRERTARECRTPISIGTIKRALAERTKLFKKRPALDTRAAGKRGAKN